ncbi:efflux RND transporter periplasmic adaptor subunit [Campylobacter geochelonis]|uniref:MacA n=1 Tax=Campylobacter geochelonis TaxID=1780362 RepID=A0A128EKT7_9BACT|nr:efflux RND transporter periplasmic adaptor subunit [Campylobacter geochelonis]QKF71195.1 macrolide-specific efflux protein, membrane fusion protein MacA [Campylobacter geochelonis]CZE48813.1 MacA [Campylobacter geochelonis]CZE48843.1 MacA [Campylobacter geochelonis]CZE49993.1 MacA [Campylobacter geochelonis]
MKKITKFIVFAIVVVGVGCYVYASFFTKKDEPSYLTTIVSKGDIKSTVIATGEVYAQDLVDVGAQVGGQIKKLYVKVGDFVKKGDIIAQIDSVKQENEVAQQEAQLLIHEANLNAAQIAAKIANLKYKRDLSLYNKKATSKEALEESQAQAALKDANVKQLLAQIEQTKIQLDTARTNLGYTKIVSPLDGTVVSVPVQEGKTVNANQTTPTIVKIADLNKMEVKMEVTEGDISKVKVGMRVKYSILSDLDNSKEANITTIEPGLTSLSDGQYGNSSGAGSSSSSSANTAVYFYANFLVDNNDNYLKIGMTTQNEILVNEAKNALFIPTSAIKRDGDKKVVYVLTNGELDRKDVVVGISDNINSQIISGLEEGQTIVISSDKGLLSNNFKPRMIRNTRI